MDDECLAVEFLSLASFDSIAAGYAAVNANESLRGFPFVVRASECFRDIATETKVRSQINKEREVKGYSCHNGSSMSSTGREALEAFDDASLAFNTVDSLSTRGNALLPDVMAILAEEANVERALWLAYVISPVTKEGIETGELHLDPPFGSNWQFLSSGTKVWYAVAIPEECKDEQQDDGEKEAFPPFILSDYSQFKSPNMREIQRLHGCVYQCTLQAGDFISIPIHWPHCVTTTEPSIGLSGYTSTPIMMRDAALLRIA